VEGWKSKRIGGDRSGRASNLIKKGQGSRIKSGTAALTVWGGKRKQGKARSCTGASWSLFWCYWESWSRSREGGAWCAHGALFKEGQHRIGDRPVRAGIALRERSPALGTLTEDGARASKSANPT